MRCESVEGGERGKGHVYGCRVNGGILPVNAEFIKGPLSKVVVEVVTMSLTSISQEKMTEAFDEEEDAQGEIDEEFTNKFVSTRRRKVVISDVVILGTWNI
jgi:hypothetical protein